MVLFDYNDDGTLTFDDVRRFLRSVVIVLYETDSRRSERRRAPEEVAIELARQAFNDIGADVNETVQSDDFRQWVQQSTLDGDDRGAPAMVDAPVTVDEVRRLTGLEQFPPDAVFALFAEATDDDGLISANAFEACFEEILDASDQELSDEDFKRLRYILSRLYFTFDADSDGHVDFTELATGLSALCGGTRDEKAAAAFALYDYNGDGVISLEEMTRYLTSVFKIMYETQPGTAERVALSPEELAANTAERAFEEADVDEDGALSFAEFQSWYSQTLSLIHI